MSEGLTENLIVSGLFWVVDVIIIVFLLPTIIQANANAKWRSMRGAITGSYPAFRDAVYHDFIGWIEEVIDNPDRADVASLISNGVDGNMRRLRDRIDVLSPALTPELSPHVLEALDSAEDIRNRLSYLFTMRRRGHPTQSIKSSAAELCDVADRFDTATSAMIKIHAPTNTHIMNPSFAFLKHFMNKYVGTLESLDGGATA